MPKRQILFVERLSTRYGRNGALAVRDVSFDLHAGESVSIIGPSGAGKSSLLRTIALLHLPTSGTIQYEGQVIVEGPNLRTEPAQYRRYVGMVHQELHLWPNRDVLANLVEAPRFVLGLSHEDAHRRARVWLERVGMSDFASRYPNELSGGQRQRIAIARSLIMEPRLVLLDEITSGLDVRSVAEVLDLLKTLRDGERSFLIVSHHLAFASAATDRSLILIDGEIVERGAASEVLSNPKHPAVRDFLQMVRSVQ